MKDVQGIQRGKCNSCECEEYRTVPDLQPGRLRCEYCNHTPGEHVRIIELGACNSCGKDECDKYQSEDPNRYTDCEYCGCPADKHAGAEKLRKPRPPMDQEPSASMMQANPSIQLRQNAYGQLVQTTKYGTCNCPGCPYPKRVEGGKVHDFCSRTCAKKYGEMQSSFYQQKITAAQAAQKGDSPQTLIRSQPATSNKPGPMSFFSKMQGQGPPMLPGPSSRSIPSSQPSVSMPSGMPTQMAGGGGKLCSKCQVKPANPGKGWCQQCFIQSQSNS